MQNYILFICLVLISFSCSLQNQNQSNLIEQLGIKTQPILNREYSFTDKQSAYWYGRTNSEGNDWFSGWNVSTEKIIQDYRLTVDGKSVSRDSAEVTVYPHKITRKYLWGEETFRLFDNKRVLMIEISTDNEIPVSIELLGYRVIAGNMENQIAYYDLKELSKLKLGVASILPSELNFKTENSTAVITGKSSSKGYFIALDSTETKVAELLKLAQTNYKTWIEVRESRMENLISDNFFKSNNKVIDDAIRWNILSLDALITQQTGDGIYAGLPWFNDYWGRDMFISLPGAALVTGEHDVARRILMSFAKYQNKEEKSIFFGRVPNRVRPDEIIYNTTDGTPRFIIALFEYIRYSGDTTLIKELYPVVQRSIEGPLKYWVDEKGYLTHDEADTWMDAKWEGKIPWSPRGNRANDIQALWFHQLQAGVYFANEMKDSLTVLKWTKIIEKLQSNFVKDFYDQKNELMADRILKSGKPDFTFRPNQLFALDFLTDQSQKNYLTKKVWDEIVYPWGVASLSQNDLNFHPWHEWETYIHKDEAYHNGTVWLWNNGIAIQRIIEAGNPNLAYELFKNMSSQTINSSGAVGALSELTEALPREGKDWPRLSGTFSQAWSSAEFLRVWYQQFIGIQPNAIDQTVLIAPNIPDSLNHLDYHLRLFDGALTGAYHRNESVRKFSYTFDSISFNPKIKIKLPTYSETSITVKSGQTLLVISSPDSVRIEVKEKQGEMLYSVILKPDSIEVEKVQLQKRIMTGVHFSRPVLNKNLECLKPENKEKLRKKLETEMKKFH